MLHVAINVFLNTRWSSDFLPRRACAAHKSITGHTAGFRQETGVLVHGLEKARLNYFWLFCEKKKKQQQQQQQPPYSSLRQAKGGLLMKASISNDLLAS